MKKITLHIIIYAFPLIFHAQGNFPFVKIDSLENILKKADSLRKQNEMYQSLELAFKAVDYAHRLDNNHYLSYAYFTMGIIQNEIMDYENAKKHLLTSLQHSEKTIEKVFLPYILHSLASLYYNIDKDYENALIYYKKAVKLAKENPTITSYQTPLINQIWTHLDLGQYKEAVQYLKEADSLDQFMTTTDANRSSLYIVKARNYAHLGEIDKAIEYFDKSEKLLEKVTYWPKGKSFLYTYRANMYEQLQEYPKVIDNLKKLQKNEHAIFNNAKLKNQEIAKIRFKVDEYERQLEDNLREKVLLMDIAKNNKIIIYISITGCLFLFGVFFFYYKGYLSKKKASEILKLKNIELSEAKSQAEKLSKIKSQFISTISHELRTPLYGVIGICSILMEDTDKSEKDKKLLNSLNFSADHLLNLVNKVLKISKINTKQIVIENIPTDLFSLAKNIVQSFEYQSEQKHNTLRLEYDPMIPNLVDLDSLRISEVLINLIGNAIKFTDHGTIFFRTKLITQTPETATIRFEIEDTGIGIPDNKKEYIFEEFSQVDNQGFENKQGTGLGLSIVKKILQLMDSSIQFKNNKDIGCTFFFDLQLAISNQTAITQYNTNFHELTDPLSAKILIAEDNKINQMVTKKLLKNISCEGLIAENGYEAVEMLKKENFDLVLMDINMPVLDGMQATQQIRKFNQDTPIIALTASELSEVEDACRNAGMNDLINKPLSKEDLKYAIANNLKAV